MRAVIIKPVVDLQGFTVFSVGQVVTGRVMKLDASSQLSTHMDSGTAIPTTVKGQWADVGTFIVKIGTFEYAIEREYFTRPLFMRLGDWLKRG